MSERNQDGYQTIGWIINKSEYGLFLAVADETRQREVVEVYRRGTVGIYDCRKYSGSYSFQKLKNWIDSVPGTQTIFIVNFQLAIQNEQDLKRLNFSRDMLAGLKKNLIFFTTPYGDDCLAVSAYDFYSFIKIRILFQDYTEEKSVNNLEVSEEDADFLQEKWNPEENRKKIKETYALVQRARELADKADYLESTRLLLEVKVIREKLLGLEHLETANVYHELASVYEKQGLYENAEKLYLNALRIRKKVLGQNHPETATSYNDIAGIYYAQGNYEKALEYYEKSLDVFKKTYGEENPLVATSYNNIGFVYDDLGAKEKALEYYEKSLDVFEKTYGEELPDVATSYNNIAGIYYAQGNYEKALEYYEKSLKIIKKTYGEELPDVATSYNNIGSVYDDLGAKEKALEYYEKSLKIIKKTYGEEHPLIAISYNNIGSVYDDLGAKEKALEYYEKSLKIIKKTYGEEPSISSDRLQ